MISKNAKPRRAIFIDRDGVLNDNIGFIHAPEQLQLLPRAAQAVARINQSPYLAICITNQPVIAYGLIDHDGLEKIHERLYRLLAMESAHLDDLFFCPHEPGTCACRKPKPGLLTAAAERHHIDLSKSWMIGDSTADAAAGKNAGCKTIGVRTGNALRDGKYDAAPDYMADTVYDAVEFILGFTRL